MNTKQRIEAVEKALALYQRMDSAWEPAVKVFGTHDNELFESCWASFDAYLDLLADSIDDEFGWTQWYFYDNDCGQKAMEAKASNWPKRKPIRSVKELVSLIEADL